MQPDYEIWLDNHLSPIIAKWLKDDLGYEVKSHTYFNWMGKKIQRFIKKQKNMVTLLLFLKILIWTK